MSLSLPSTSLPPLLHPALSFCLSASQIFILNNGLDVPIFIGVIIHMQNRLSISKVKTQKSDTLQNP